MAEGVVEGSGSRDVSILRDVPFYFGVAGLAQQAVAVMAQPAVVACLQWVDSRTTAVATIYVFHLALLFEDLVGTAGFEPATFCLQSRRDNQATLRPDNFVWRLCILVR